MILNRLLRRFGFRVARVGSEHSLLAHLASMGVSPRTIFDVGAAYGDWSRQALAEWPEAHLVAIEPLEEYAPFLSRLDYHSVALADIEGTKTINVHADLVGSSLLKEAESWVNGEPREVKVITLDSIASSYEAPFGVKIDAQGAELIVLSGAQKTLPEAEFVLLELTTFDVFEGGPSFAEVISSMDSIGFCLYDINEILYRPLDGAMWQADAVFVPNNSRLRSDHVYATRDQRKKQDDLFRSHYEQRRA